MVGNSLLYDVHRVLRPWQVLADGSLRAACAGPVSLDVLGTSITYGAGGPDVPVMIELDDGSGFQSLFGGGVTGGESHQIAWVEVGTEFDVRGIADGFGFYAAYASGSSDPHVVVLQDGDAVPDKPEFGDQDSIESFLQPYIDVATGTVTLENSQAILLFEFNPSVNSLAADFQDLVALFDFQGELCDA